MQDPEQEHDAGAAIEAESLDVCVPLSSSSYIVASDAHHSPNLLMETPHTQVQREISYTTR
jgi:hypothetical protein